MTEESSPRVWIYILGLAATVWIASALIPELWALLGSGVFALAFMAGPLFGRASRNDRRRDTSVTVRITWKEILALAALIAVVNAVAKGYDAGKVLDTAYGLFNLTK